MAIKRAIRHDCGFLLLQQDHLSCIHSSPGFPITSSLPSPVIVASLADVEIAADCVLAALPV